MSDKLNSPQQRRLHKMIQIALDRSAAALKIMLGGKIKIGLVRAPLQTPGICVRLGLSGDLKGDIYIDLPEKMAVEIVKTLTAGDELSLLDEAARSALMEMGNILASVFVGYFDQHHGLRTLPMPPEFSLAPIDIPIYAEYFTAEFFWGQSLERAGVLIGLERSALDILFPK